MSNILNTFNSRDYLIKKYQHWYLLLRSDQVTLGSLVLIEKDFHQNFSDISSESFKEFGKIIKEIETSLMELFEYEKINYLMLMMKDKEVHFHVIPRYSKDKYYEFTKFQDLGWPGMPDLKKYNRVDEDLKLMLKKSIKEVLPN